MTHLHYQKTQLYLDEISLEDIAKQYGTPCYVYSKLALQQNWQTFNSAFANIPHLICYAVKANGNLAILQTLADLQSGFDIVSIGELERVLKAGGDPQRIVFSGVGKNTEEITRALLANIFCFNVESPAEIERLQTIAAKLQVVANIALRINPNVDSGSHAHIATGRKENKFGIEIADILPLCQQIKTMRSLNLIGLACHIGSQILSLTPFLTAADHLIDLYQQCLKSGFPIQFLNMGGGLGIAYGTEKPPAIEAYAQALTEKFSHYPIKLILEPGRAIVGNTGLLLTRVEYIKHGRHKNFAIVDTGMNDLLRPALYDAWQDILPVTLRESTKNRYDISGPICESADFLGKDRELALLPNDLLAIAAAGAYGFSMSSNYNARVRPAEVLVDGRKTHLIRKRETINDLFAQESLI